MQEYTKPCFAIDDVKNEHMAPLLFENELEIDRIEQRPTFNHKGYPCLFVDFQDEVFFHVFEDYFFILLQPSKKVGFMLFTRAESGFRLYFELLFTKFLFLHESERKEQSNNHLLSWLHWSF